MTAPRPHSRQPKQLDAGILQAEITSFRLRLAAEDKSAKTIRTYIEAVQWFAAYLLEQASRDSWGQVDGQDIQRWMVRLLDRYSSAYASNQCRALQQFFKWLAAEDELPDPMAGLQPPHVTEKLVPVFTGEGLTKLEQACAGRTCSGGWRGCSALTAAPMPAISTGRCSSSSSGWLPKRSCLTRWPGCSRRTSPASSARSSPVTSCRGWSASVRAGRSRSAGTQR